jgi:ABC-type multidrug transport system fused ATPase/permease subunit
LEARRKQSRTVVEAYRGYAELEIARAFHTSLASFDQGMEFIVHNRLRMEVYQLFPSFLSEVAVVAGLALLIGTGSGDLGLVSGVFAVAAFRLIPAVRAVLNSWVTLQNASHTITVVKEGIAVMDNGLQENLPSEPPFEFKHTLELHGLEFAFPDGHTLFGGLDLVVGRGERIGVRGASGSGKSTLFNLMLGFLPPTSGGILIDGKKLTSANRSEWHKLVGYVPQEIFTLADNIALGQPKVDRTKMIQVLEQVQLKEWVDELPQGLDTPLGEYGSRLSGGQKQRIGIARALYKEAEVLFFDEATSALDNKTEQEINHALEILSRQHRELTLIVIAHRESSLAFCDRIFDLDSGNIYTKEK